MNTRTQTVLTNKARALVGCHYLTGGAGATPDGVDGALYRRGEVGLVKPLRFDPKNPCIYAAESGILGHSVCGGRDAQHDALADDPVFLKQYLQDQEAQFKSTGKVLPAMGLTPRRVEFKDKVGKIVWGEDCRGKRHFDCIGVVNYLLSQVCDLSKSFAGKGFSANIDMHRSATKSVPLAQPSQAGDILYTKIDGHDHLAMLLNDEQVIQAVDTHNGVVITPYNSSSWLYRGRYADNLFLSLAEPEPLEVSTF